MSDPALITEWKPAYIIVGGHAKPESHPTTKKPLAKLRTPTGICPACFNYPNCDHDAPAVFCVTLDGVADTNKPSYNKTYFIPGTFGYSGFRLDKYVTLNQTFFVSHFYTASVLDGSYSCSYFYINNPGDPNVLLWAPPLVPDSAHPAAFDTLRVQDVIDPSYTPIPPTPSILPTPGMVSPVGGVPILPTFGVLVTLDNPYTGPKDGELILTVSAGAGTQDSETAFFPQYLHFFGQILLPGPGCLKDAPYIVPNVLAQSYTTGPTYSPLHSGVNQPIYAGDGPPTNQDVDPDTGIITELRGVWWGTGGQAVVRPLLGIPLDSCNTYRVYNCCTFWMYQWNCYTNSTVEGVVKYMPAECAEATPHAFQQLGKPDDSTGMRIFTYLAITSNVACDGIGEVCADDDSPPSPPSPPTLCASCPTEGGCEAYRLHFTIGGTPFDDLIVRDGTTMVWTSGSVIADCFRGSQRIQITTGGGSALFLKVIHGDALDFAVARWVKISDTISGGCEYLGGECATCPTDTSTFCQRMGVVIIAGGFPVRITLAWSGGAITTSDARLVVACEDGVYTMNFTYEGVSYVWKAGAAMDGSFPFGATNWTAQFDDLDISLDEVACWDCDDSCTVITVAGEVNGVDYTISLTKGAGCVWTGTNGGATGTLTGYGKTSILNVHVGVDVGETTEDRQATFLITSSDNDPTNMTSYIVYTPTDADPPNTLRIITCGESDYVCLYTFVASCDESGTKSVALADARCRARGELTSPMETWLVPFGVWSYYRLGPVCTGTGDDAVCDVDHAGTPPAPPNDTDFPCEPSEEG